MLLKICSENDTKDEWYVTHAMFNYIRNEVKIKV